jgi:chemotaxis protein methyltransferase CheR
MAGDDFDGIRGFLERACGITLGPDKNYLITSRLTPLLTEFRLGSLRELLERALADRGTQLRDRIVDAMTTNETQWFRDTFPYEILKRHIFPEYARARRNGLRIWSAASSSGQEPYSLSMTADEFKSANPGTPLQDIQILGTDISPTMLSQAMAAQYDGIAMARGLSEERRNRYFIRQGDRWSVKAEIRQRVSFREWNLTQPYEPLGRFDIVFCRNVLIYFSTELKRDILARLSAVLNPRGYLVLGAAESLAGHTDAFDMLRLNEGIVYQLKDKLAVAKRA